MFKQLATTKSIDRILIIQKAKAMASEYFPTIPLLDTDNCLISIDVWFQIMSYPHSKYLLVSRVCHPYSW